MIEVIENVLKTEETPTWQNPLLKWKHDLENALLGEEDPSKIVNIQDKLRMLESLGV